MLPDIHTMHTICTSPILRCLYSLACLPIPGVAPNSKTLHEMYAYSSLLLWRRYNLSGTCFLSPPLSPHSFFPSKFPNKSYWSSPKVFFCETSDRLKMPGQSLGWTLPFCKEKFFTLAWIHGPLRNWMAGIMYHTLQSKSVVACQLPHKAGGA